MGWLSILLGFADPIAKIAGTIAQSKIAAQNAATEQERIAADERTKTLELQRDIMVAESGSRINALVRLAFAVPPAVYLAKLFLWDKVLGWGITDPLSPMMENVLWTVVGFYFLQWTISRTMRVAKR